MLWAVSYYWPSDAIFVSNCYKQWCTLVVRDDQESVCFVQSRKGVTQGDPISMVTYGLGILPIIRFIKTLVLAPHQPWYADSATIIASWALIVQYFNTLTNHRLRFGFYPKPKKSIVVVKEGQEEDATQFFLRL